MSKWETRSEWFAPTSYIGVRTHTQTHIAKSFCDIPLQTRHLWKPTPDDTSRDSWKIFDDRMQPRWSWLSENSLTRHLQHCCFKRYLIIFKVAKLSMLCDIIFRWWFESSIFHFYSGKTCGRFDPFVFLLFVFCGIAPSIIFSKQKVQTFFYRTKKSIWDSFFFLKIDTQEANKTFFVDGFKNPALWPVETCIYRDNPENTRIFMIFTTTNQLRHVSKTLYTP